MKDEAVTVEMPETVMAERCSDCAMRCGTDANKSSLTRAVFDLCLMVGLPFYCHETPGVGNGHLCRGFHDAFEAKLNRGDYGQIPYWKQSLAYDILDLITEMETGVKPSDGEERLWAMIAGIANGEGK